MTLRTTPLIGTHRAGGARLVDFGGWEMPAEYATGVLAEHAAVRDAVGVFDVSHMGKLVVRGPGAVADLDRVLCNELARIGPGRAQYSMLLDDDGGVIDDLIVYRVSDDEVRIVPNATNAETVRDALDAALPAPVRVTDLHAEQGILAVQGPASRAVLRALGLLPGSDDPAGQDDLAYMAFTTTRFGSGTSQSDPVVVCRTGYTGEHGYELIASRDDLEALWAGALAAGAVPCGLGARDTLRTEMGYPLHGQDLSRDITPLEAGLSWAVGWDKSAFVGRESLIAQRASGRRRAARGLLVQGRGIPRPGMVVATAEGAGIGRTTSGTFSPTLRTGIALALLDPSASPGDELVIDVRGRAAVALVVAPPFVDRSPR